MPDVIEKNIELFVEANFLVFPVYENWTKKHWMAGKPPEETDFLTLLETGSIIDRWIRVDMISGAWPFDENVSVLETMRGGNLVAMSFSDLVAKLKKASLDSSIHCPNHK